MARRRRYIGRGEFISFSAKRMPQGSRKPKPPRSKKQANPGKLAPETYPIEPKRPRPVKPTGPPPRPTPVVGTRPLPGLNRPPANTGPKQPRLTPGGVAPGLSPRQAVRAILTAIQNGDVNQDPRGVMTTHQTQSPLYPYYYTFSNDPGYGYIHDVHNPGNPMIRKPLDELLWEIGITEPPKGEETQETYHGVAAREQSVSALEGPIDVIYGQDRIGPRIFDFVQGTWTDDLGQRSGVIQAHGLGQGEIDSIVKIEIGDYSMPLKSTAATADTGFTGKYAGSVGVSYRWYNGANTQVVDSDLKTIHEAAGHGTYSYTYPGFAYVTWRVAFPENQDSLVASFPTPLYTVKGKKILDPRLGTDANGLPNAAAVWSDNPALILADYLWNPYYGVGCGLSGVDWTSVTAAANYCDETIGATSVTKIDVTYGGGHWNPTPPAVVISAPTGSSPVQATAYVSDYTFNGEWWEVKQITVKNPGNGYTSTPTISFTRNDGASTANNATATATRGQKRHSFNMAISRPASHKAIIDMIRNSFRACVLRRDGKRYIAVDKRRDTPSHAFTADNSRPVSIRRNAYATIPNRVVVTWINPQANYAEEKAVAETAGVTAGTETIREAQYAAEACRNAMEAQMMAYYLLNKKLLNLGAVLIATNQVPMRLEPLDHVTWTSNSVALSAQSFAVDAMDRTPDGEYRFSLSQYSSSLYDDQLATVDTAVSTTFTDPSLTPPPSHGLTVSYLNWSTDTPSATAWWLPPEVLTKDYYVSGYTSIGSTLNFNAARCGDGNWTTEALRVNAGAVGGVQLDMGTAKLFDVLHFGTTTDVPWGDRAITIYYSDNGTTWTTLTGWSHFVLHSAPSGYQWVAYTNSTGTGAAKSTVPHRYWRFEFRPVTNPIILTEFWPRARTGIEYDKLAGYHILYHTSAETKVVDTIYRTPTEAAPYTVPASVFSRITLPYSGLKQSVNYLAVQPFSTASYVGPILHPSQFVFSGGAPAGTAATEVDYIPMENETYAATGSFTLTPSLSTGVMLVTLTADATLVGVASQYSGRRLVVSNHSTFTINLPHESASGAAGQKISTGSAGSALTIGPYESVELIYDGTASKWRVRGGPTLWSSLESKPSQITNLEADIINPLTTGIRSKSKNTTATNITTSYASAGISLTLAASEVWEVEVLLDVDTGFSYLHFQPVLPSGATIAWSAVGGGAGGAAAMQQGTGAMTANAFGGTQDTAVMIKAIVTVGGTAGTLTWNLKTDVFTSPSAFNKASTYMIGRRIS